MSVLCETEKPQPLAPGIGDVGIEDLAVMDSGIKYSSPPGIGKDAFAAEGGAAHSDPKNKGQQALGEAEAEGDKAA